MGVAIYSTRNRGDGTWTIRGSVAGIDVIATVDGLGDDPTMADCAGALAAHGYIPARNEQAGAPLAERAADNPAPGDANGAGAGEASPDTGSIPVPGSTTAVEESAPAVQPDEFPQLKGIAAVVCAWVGGIEDATELVRVQSAETAGKGRKTVLEAIAARIAELGVAERE